MSAATLAQAIDLSRIRVPVLTLANPSVPPPRVVCLTPELTATTLTRQSGPHHRQRKRARGCAQGCAQDAAFPRCAEDGTVDFKTGQRRLSSIPEHRTEVILDSEMTHCIMGMLSPSVNARCAQTIAAFLASSPRLRDVTSGRT